MAGKDVDVVVDRSPDREPVASAGLNSGWKKASLIRDIAMGELTQTRLGELYGVSQATISRFAQRHAADIHWARRRMMEGVQTGTESLWVVSKINRIAEHQRSLEQLAPLDSPRAVEVRTGVLKAVAEELGDLPARTNVNISNETTVYEMVGVDPEDI